MFLNLYSTPASPPSIFKTTITLLLLLSIQINLFGGSDDFLSKHFYSEIVTMDNMADIEVNYEFDFVQVTQSTNDIPIMGLSTYKLIVTNNGPDEATNVWIFVNYHDEVIPYNRNMTSGYWDNYHWVIPNLPAGATVELTEYSNILYPFNDKWVQASLEQMDQDDSDSTPGNWDFTEDDSDQLEILFPECDLDLTLAVNNPEYEEYEYVYYEVVVQNFGPSIATGVSANIPLPDGMVVSSSTSASQGSYSSYYGNWDIGTLEIGETVLLNLVLFPLDEDGPKTVFAQIQTVDQPDPDSSPGNDSDQSPDEDDEAKVIVYPIGTSNCSGNLTLNSQSEIDAFGPCTIFDGSIYISGNDISDFSAFDGLEEVTGSLTFVGLDNLQEITGFNQLETIGESLDIDGNSDLLQINAFYSLASIEDELRIFTNTNLQDIQGFNNLESAYTLLLENNIALTNIDAFSSLTALQRIEFSFNPSLENVDGLSNIQPSIEFIKILESTSLQNINGLSQITDVASHCLFFENTILESFDPLSNLISVGGILSIEHCQYITNLDGLSNLETIGSDLFINSNYNLENLDGLSNLQSVGSGILMTTNTALNDCCGIYPLLSTNGVAGSINISDNGSACNSVDDILMTCAPTNCSGDIQLSNQAEVDAFGPCTVFDGSIQITGDDITDLSAFNGLQEITGTLYISMEMALQLDGFHELESIGENLVIANHNVLTTLTAFENLANIGEDFVLTSNSNLTTLTGFGNLESVTDFVVQVNAALPNLDAFSNLSSVENLLIEFNSSMQNIDGLSNIPSSLTSIRLIENYALESIEGLSQITNVDEAYIIAECLVLESLDPLSNLNSVGGSLIISILNLVEDVDGLSNLTTVGGFLMSDMDLITDVDGLSNLQTVENNFYLDSSPLLSDCCGIYPLLSSNGVGGSINIFGNQNGCNSAAEVIAACEPTVSCSGNITLTTQAEVDAFGPCTVYDGTIRIEGVDITDFSAFDGLEEITGSLNIEETGVVQFDGFNELETVGNSLRFFENYNMVSLDGFANLQSVNVEFYLVNHPLLTAIQGFENLETLDEFYLWSNDMLTNVDAFSSVSYLEFLEIIGNENLGNIDGFSNVTSSMIYIELNDIPNLQSLEGLSGISTITSNLIIFNCHSLENLDGLSTLNSVSRLSILNNDELQNLDALSNLQSITSLLEVENNDQLSDCCGLYPVLSNNGVTGNIEISGNQMGCNSAADILDNCVAVDYCESYGDFPWHDWIGKVSVAGIDHSSGKSKYSDFTYLEAFVQSGNNYPLDLTTRYSWTTYDEYWKIWIDYNQNNSFDEPEEIAFAGIINKPPNGTPSANITGSISIPTNAMNGYTRMRVSMKRGDYPSPCEVFDYGEVEDYSILINNTINIRMADAVNADSDRVVMYPNPAKDELFIYIPDLVGQNGQLQIQDVLGRIVLDQNMIDIPDEPIQIDLDDFKNGLYLISLNIDDRKIISQKLMVESGD